jgi:hypothetical protein
VQAEAASWLCQSTNGNYGNYGNYVVPPQKPVDRNKKPREAQRLNGVFRFA